MLRAKISFRGIRNKDSSKNSTLVSDSLWCFIINLYTGIYFNLLFSLLFLVLGLCFVYRDNMKTDDNLDEKISLVFDIRNIFLQL